MFVSQPCPIEAKIGKSMTSEADTPRCHALPVLILWIGTVPSAAGARAVGACRARRPARRGRGTTGAGGQQWGSRVYYLFHRLLFILL